MGAGTWVVIRGTEMGEGRSSPENGGGGPRRRAASHQPPKISKPMNFFGNNCLEPNLEHPWDQSRLHNVQDEIPFKNLNLDSFVKSFFPQSIENEKLTLKIDMGSNDPSKTEPICSGHLPHALA